MRRAGATRTGGLCAAALAVAACGVLPVPAGAVERGLTARSMAQAVAAGRDMATQQQGYAFGPYLLFSVPDALRAGDDRGRVEAIVLGTPYERLRYRAYLLARQGLGFKPGAIAAFAAAHRGKLDLVVFAHSRTPDDRDFMDAFGGGTLDGPAGFHRAPFDVAHTTPIRDAYYTPDGKPVMRWLGRIRFRFTIPPPGALAPGTTLRFSFRDDAGTPHTASFALDAVR